MKTLSEAVSLFQVTTVKKLDEQEQKQITDSIMLNHSRYKELISEAQDSPEIHTMAMAMAQMGLDMQLGMIGTIVVAISHAIAIGIEMEKPDNVTS